MDRPIIYADFHNADSHGRLRLNCVGTVRDLAQRGVVLREGLQLILDDGECSADGHVQHSAEENGWVAVIDWQAVRQNLG